MWKALDETATLTNEEKKKLSLMPSNIWHLTWAN